MHVFAVREKEREREALHYPGIQQQQQAGLRDLLFPLLLLTDLVSLIKKPREKEKQRGRGE